MTSFRDNDVEAPSSLTRNFSKSLISVHISRDVVSWTDVSHLFGGLDIV
jgi:hypothetical protein